MNVVIGFDPGGAGTFGWCVAAGSQLPLNVMAKGTNDHADGACDAAMRAAEKEGVVAGVGIDAPLFWRRDGDRIVDRDVRQEICRLGAKGGTVNSINSMRGACLIQGVMAAMLFRQRQPGVPLTESHPKAMLWLLREAVPGRPSRDVALADLANYFVGDVHDACDHERDAALATLSALALTATLDDWHNLFPRELKPMTPLDPVPGYWMPL